MISGNILLADCDKEEVESLRENLVFRGVGFSTVSKISNWKRTGKMSEIKRYFTYFKTAFEIYLHRGRYNAIVGWQQFYALIVAFYYSLFHSRKKNFIVALNFTYKEKGGFKGKIYAWFMKKCVNPKYMDYLHILSYEYADKISCTFGFPRERIIVTPFGVNDCYEEYSKLHSPEGYSKEGYALAIGRSNRDFDFLIESWEKIDFPLVVIGDTYQGNNRGNINVSIRRDIAGEDSYPWISNCRLMIVPIDDPAICSGDTVLLNAMACKKIVVVTAPSTLAEMYISNGIDGYTVEKDKNIFEKLIIDILNSSSDVAKNARDSFLARFSRSTFGVNISNAINKENV